jgi:hypothetical protein
MRLRPASPLLFLMAWLACVGTLAAAATETLAELQDRFDHEDNAVHRAKLMQKLGDAQFAALHAAEKAEDYNVVGTTLEKYRDNVRTALTALKKAQPDAERKSNGYRQLQIHLSRGIREAEEALRSSPDEYRPPLELVRRDLLAMNDEMLRLLFPARPAPKPQAKPAVAPEPKTAAPSDSKPNTPPDAKPPSKDGPP